MNYFLLAQFAQADNAGLAVYAIQSKHWKCNPMIEAYKKADLEVYRLQWLWHTFGDGFGCLNKFGDIPGHKVWAVHLVNEVCIRNGVCGSYELGYGMTPGQYQKKWKEKNTVLINKFRNNIAPLATWMSNRVAIGDSCYVSPGLESNIKDIEAANNLITEARTAFPHCLTIWNPVESNPLKNIPGTIREFHRYPPNAKAPCITNLDGVDVTWPNHVRANGLPESEIPSYLNQSALCDAAFPWISEFNLRLPGPFIDPRLRKANPSAQAWKKIGNWIAGTDSTAPPWSSEDDKAKVGCNTFLDISDGYKKGFLWKQSEPPCCNRGAVTFLPPAYNQTSFKLSDIFVMKKDKKIATAYERGVYTEDGSNRQFWRYHKLAEDFPYNIVAHYGTVCAVIPNPKVRND